MNNKSLGKRIKDERLKLNLTQEKLAEYLEISDSYLGQIERGERSLTLDTLVRLTNRLGVTIDYLLQDSVLSTDENYINQFKQLIHNRSDKEKRMALDVIKIMYSHLDEE